MKLNRTTAVWRIVINLVSFPIYSFACSATATLRMWEAFHRAYLHLSTLHAAGGGSCSRLVSRREGKRRKEGENGNKLPGSHSSAVTCRWQLTVDGPAGRMSKGNGTYPELRARCSPGPPGGRGPALQGSCGAAALGQAAAAPSQAVTPLGRGCRPVDLSCPAE